MNKRVNWYLRIWLLLFFLSSTQLFALQGKPISKIDSNKLLRLTSKSKIYCYKPNAKAFAGILIKERKKKKQIKTWIKITKAKRLRIKTALKLKKSAKKLNAECTLRFGTGRSSDQMPLGIPAPSFGINETYRMYDDPTARNTGLTYTQNSEGGYYTHYVDNSLPDCASNPEPCSTDDNNSFGTSTRARQTIPESLLAGSVVEVHGTLYTYSNGPSNELLVAGIGTQQQPIFIRGANSNGVKPIFSQEWGLGFYDDTRYIIFENIHGHGWGISGRRDGEFETSHIVLRHSEMEGDINDSGGIGIASYTSNSISNIVIYNTSVHDNGIWDPNEATGDRDFHGITIGSKVSHVWVLNCTIFHNEGDGLQVNSDPSDVSHHIYVGGNTAHHNKQSGLGFKYAQDVIVSENTVYGHRPSSSAPGNGIGEQYGPVRTWFLFNHLYDNEIGFIINSTSGPGFDGEGDGTYFIGNVLHDIHHSSSTWNPSGGPDCIAGSAFCLRANKNRYVIGNTMYDVNAGISMLGTATVENNIVSNISEIAYAHHLRMDASTSAISNASIANNLFYQSGDSSKIRIIAGSNYSSPVNLNNFQSTHSGNCSGCLDTTDPAFVNADSDDFNIQVNSGARNKGKATTIEELASTFQSLYGVDIRTDLNRVARPQEGAWDIGAYEVAS